VVKIGQKEILEYLKKNKGQWFSGRELSKKIKIRSCKGGTLASKLARFGFVKREFRSDQAWYYCYKEK
jgi:hypothetical protein